MATNTATRTVVVRTNSRGVTQAVGKGFYGEDPKRTWVDPTSDDARTFENLDKAEGFIFRTGDPSWGLRAIEVAVKPVLFYTEADVYRAVYQATNIDTAQAVLDALLPSGLTADQTAEVTV